MQRRIKTAKKYNSNHEFTQAKISPNYFSPFCYTRTAKSSEFYDDATQTLLVFLAIAAAFAAECC